MANPQRQSVHSSQGRQPLSGTINLTQEWPHARRRKPAVLPSAFARPNGRGLPQGIGLEEPMRRVAPGRWEEAMGWPLVLFSQDLLPVSHSWLPEKGLVLPTLSHLAFCLWPASAGVYPTEPSLHASFSVLSPYFHSG
jgi:hypothetical protein